MEIALTVLYTLLGVVVLFVLWVILAGGSLGRLPVGCQAFLRALRDAAWAEKVLQEPATPPQPKPEVKKPSGEALRLLAILQRESRLVDFLMDDLSRSDDAQIAAALRDLQPKARAALEKHVQLEPILPEGQDTVEVPAGFDPSAIQLIGNVSGQPPFRGTLNHPGWRVRELNIPPLPKGYDEFVIAPAQVELS
jgi:hypothetical protein